MQYFRLKQSVDILQHLRPDNYPAQYINLKIKMQDEEKLLQEAGSYIYKVKTTLNENELPDFIETPFPLVSTELKKVMESYQTNTVFLPVTFVEPDRGSIHSFWQVFAPRLKCLSWDTKLTVNQGLREFWLVEAIIEDSSLFTLEGVLNNILVARLDLAESIYKRNFKGILYEKISVVEGEKKL